MRPTPLGVNPHAGRSPAGRGCVRTKAVAAVARCSHASLSVFMERTNPSNPIFGPPDNPYGRIIGVAGDVKEGTLQDGTEPTVFYNERQLPSNGRRCSFGRRSAQT
jgi:hypothetical protein